MKSHTIPMLSLLIQIAVYITLCKEKWLGPIHRIQEYD